MTGAGVSATLGARPRGRFLTPIIILRQKTPPVRAGDEGRPGAPCGRLPAYRRACGNLRLWSGAATQGAHERVRRSRQGTPVRFAVFGPGIPCLQAWGVVKMVLSPMRRRNRPIAQRAFRRLSSQRQTSPPAGRAGTGSSRSVLGGERAQQAQVVVGADARQADGRWSTP